MTSGVYWIYQPSQDRAVYVGSSMRIEDRIRNHRHWLITKTHPNPHLQLTWDKYGSADFEFMILECALPEQLKDREQFWMDAIAPSCNIAVATNSPSRGRKFPGTNLGMRHSDETKKQRSEAMRGRTVSAETRLKISQSLKGQPISPERRQKISEATKRAMARPEVRKKLIDGLRGRGLGRVVSDETRRRISETKRKRSAERKASQ